VPRYYYPNQNAYSEYNNGYPSPNFVPPRGYEYTDNQYPYPEEGQPEALVEEQEYQTPTANTGGVVSTSTAPAEIPSVQTPQDTQDTSTAAAPAANSNMDALDIQLAAALEAVKADMISKGKQVLEEKQWTDDVKGVIDQYQHKITNVYKNIEKLKVDMGDLYKKKQQILNAQIQKSLTAKLKDSKEDLNTVQAALDKVMNTQAEFEQSKKDIQGTIDSIYTQLAELKGQATVTAGAGGAASGAAPGSSPDGAAADSQAAPADSSSDSSDSSTDGSSDTDSVDQQAEMQSHIDAIKSIVDALNK
jgi:hypothetical protein